LFLKLSSCLLLSQGNSLLLFLDVRLGVFEELRDHTCSNSLAAFSKRETLADVDGQREVQLHCNREVVTWQGHLDFRWKLDISGCVGSTNEALGSVAVVERLATTTFLRLEHVDLSLAVSSNLDTARLGKAHTTLDLLLSNATQKHANIVTSLSVPKLLVEGFDTRDNARGCRSTDADQMHIIVDLAFTLFHRASCDDTSACNGETAINRHQEILVLLALGLSKDRVHRLSQLFHGTLTEHWVRSLKCGKCAALDEGGFITIVLVVSQELTHFHLDQLVHLLIFDQVTLVKEHNNVFDTDLSAKEDVFARLGHGAISGRHDQDASIHTSSTGDHVLDVIGVAWAVDVAIVAIGSLVLDASSVDGNATRLFFG